MWLIVEIGVPFVGVLVIRALVVGPLTSFETPMTILKGTVILAGAGWLGGMVPKLHISVSTQPLACRAILPAQNKLKYAPCEKEPFLRPAYKSTDPLCWIASSDQVKFFSTQKFHIHLL